MKESHLPSLHELKALLEEHSEDLIAFRRDLHRNPELSWQEKRTAQKIESFLKRRDLRPQTGKAGGTGLWLDFGQHPRVAYRADIDALPIKDLKTVSYASQIPGLGHHCGHDVHTTIALGIVLLLQKINKSTPVHARIFWQPAEEFQPSGAPVMIKNGVLKGIKTAFAVHVDPTINFGEIGIKEGPVNATYKPFTILVTTPGTLHSARPFQGPNVVSILSQLTSDLEQLPFRHIDTRNPAVVCVTQIHTGDALNVVSNTGTLAGTIRTRFDDDLDRLMREVVRLAGDYEKRYGIRVGLNFTDGAPSVINDEDLVQYARKLSNEWRGNPRLVDFNPSMGGEDFAFYSRKVRSLMLRMGSRSSESTGWPLHSNQFDVDERVIVQAASVMAQLILHYP